jgi:hypothetical protein
MKWEVENLDRSTFLIRTFLIRSFHVVPGHEAGASVPARFVESDELSPKNDSLSHSIDCASLSL